MDRMAELRSHDLWEPEAAEEVMRNLMIRLLHILKIYILADKPTEQTKAARLLADVE